MIDLSSTLFFKGKVEISSEPECDLLWELVMDIRKWMTAKWKRADEAIPYELPVWSAWKRGSDFSSENNIVHFKSSCYSGREGQCSWACKIFESRPPQNGFAPREWVTEIGYQQSNATKGVVSIVIYYSDRPGFIGPCEPAPQGSIPRLIWLLCESPNIHCTASGCSDFLRPSHLKPGGFPEFWRFVCDEERDIPVVYLSPRKTGEGDTDRAVPLLDPTALVKLLGPNALVYYADDLDFSREMTQLCTPDSIGCYSGAIRIYAAHPHVKNPEDSYRHRLICAKDIQGNEEAVYEILRRALAQDVHFYEKMFRMEDCQKLLERARSEQKMREYRETLERELADTTIEKEQKLQQELDKIEEQRFEWEYQCEELKTTIAELKEDLHKERAASDSFRTEAALSSQRKASLDAVRQIDKFPDSPEKIGQYFELHFKDRIAFTEQGKESLADCSADPKILWDALYQMATRLYDLYESDEVSLIDQEFNRVSSFQMARGAGRMTRKDAELMRQYQDTYDGRTISIETHIKSSQSKPKSPQFLRIYYCYDRPTQKIVIGSCGRHLDNYSTQKIQ